MTIYLDNAHGKGRGVFAAKDFKKGELIEECPVLVLSDAESALVDKTELTNYYFLWGDEEPEQKIAICFGYGSMYNHSPKPNADFDFDYENERIVFTALKDIKQGEEILIDYEWDVDEKTPSWYRPSGA